jgi:hypothetical protein
MIQESTLSPSYDRNDEVAGYWEVTMATLQSATSIDIAASPDAVWDLLMQPARYTELMEPSDEMVDLGDGVVKEGYVYTVQGGIPPFKGTSTWTVTTVDPKSLQVHDGNDGKVEIHTDWRITPTESGSHLSHTAELTPQWYLAPVMAVMWPLMMRKRTQAAMEKTMANFKRIAEAEDS